MPDQKEMQMHVVESTTCKSVKGASPCDMRFPPVRDVTGREDTENEIVASDEMYKGVVENIAIGVALISPNMEILTLNSQMRNWFPNVDFSNHPICYRSFNDPPREDICPYCPTCKTLKDGQVHEAMTETPSKGGIINFRVVSSPIRDIEGRVIAAIEMAEDISERKRMEELLRESEERFHIIANSALDAIVMTDDNGNITFWNTAAEKIFGYSEAEVLGKSMHSLLMPTWDEESIKRLLDKPKRIDRKRDEESATEISMAHHDGRSIPVELSVSAIELKGRWYFISIIRDISELKRSRVQLVQSEKLAAIGTLAAGVAHEINNPIGYVSSNLNTLGKYLQKIKGFLEKNASQENEGWLEIKEIIVDSESAIMESLEGVSRVKKIVTDLKSFSRVDRAEKEYANINEGIESTLNIVWNELKYKCQVEKQLGQIPELYCMPNQLNQVFMNLLVNAGQAISGDKGLILIRTWADPGNVYISIRDNGTGISKENLGKIFEAFFTTKEVGKGTGLGLSLAYDIVKKHNGKIEVTSELGVGTEFIVTLPIEGGLSE